MLKLIGRGNLLGLTQPGPLFKHQRAYMHKLFGNQAALRRENGIVEGESQRFLQQVLSSPDDLADCARLYVHFDP
jgi:hypothetical protein